MRELQVIQTLSEELVNRNKYYKICKKDEFKGYHPCHCTNLVLPYHLCGNNYIKDLFYDFLY